MDEENRLEIYEPTTHAIDRRRPAALPPRDMSERVDAPELLAYWRVIRKRRWTILSILFVVFIIVLIGTLKEKPIYRAKALLEIEKENPNILTVQELFELESVSDTYLMTQYKVLRSESLARRVIDQLHLDQVKEFNPPRPWWQGRAKKDAPTASAFAAADSGSPADPDAGQITLKNFEDALSVDPIKQSRLVEVGFESQDPALAAEAVNTLSSNYINQNLELRWDATQRASEWLSQQLVGMKAKLEKSEDEMQEYARENGLLYLESEKGTPENIVDERLRQLQDELTKAQADRYQKESIYRLVQAGDFGSLPGVVENRLMQDLTLRLSDLETSYAQLATTFSPDYPKLKQLQNQIDQTKNMLARERKRAAQRITNDYAAALRREALVQHAFEEQQKQANEVAEKSVQYNILKREVDTNKQLYEGLLQRLKEAGVSAGLKASNIRVVDAAVPPRKPAKPLVLLNLALGAVVGLGLGVGAAFLQEHLDNTLKTAADVERFLQLPALAMIPAVESLNGHLRSVYSLQGRGRLLDGGDDKPPSRLRTWYRIDEAGPQYSALSEAFRSLRTSVLLSTADRPPRSLLITSAQPAEGKTTVSTNLSISLAQLGQRVLLVDGDLRRPNIHRVFEIKDAPGLVGYLTGQQEWAAAVLPTPVSGLDVIPSGPVPPNPAELLSSDRMRVLVREAMERYNVVVVDSPPMLNVADSRVLATQMEGVVLVVKGSVTPRELAQRAQAYAHDVGANVIGVVLNNVDVRGGDYDYYRYDQYEYYGDQPDERRRAN